MKHDKSYEILLELYKVGRRIQPFVDNTNLSLPTQTRFQKALDAAQDQLFPASKSRIKLKEDSGMFFLMGERLVQIGSDALPWRWVMRRDLKGVKKHQIKHILLFEGHRSNYSIEARLYEDSLEIGCVYFNKESLQQIKTWLKKGK